MMNKFERKLNEYYLLMKNFNFSIDDIKKLKKYEINYMLKMIS